MATKSGFDLSKNQVAVQSILSIHPQQTEDTKVQETAKAETKASEKTRYTFWLDKSLADDFQHVAYVMGEKYSQIITRLMRQYVDEHAEALKQYEEIQKIKQKAISR